MEFMLPTGHFALRVIQNGQWLGLFLAILAITASSYVGMIRSQKVSPESLANFGTYLIYRFFGKFIFGGISLIVLFGAYRYRVLDITPDLKSFFICLLVMDFLMYWSHRIEHRVRLFWCMHSVHHSSPEFNLTTATRLPFLWHLYDGFFWVPAALLGFHPIIIIASKVVILIYQFFIHTEKVPAMSGVDLIFNTPSNHRVHHGSNPLYLDKNYGQVTMIWDHLFGSYQRETEPVTYGLTHPINTCNILKINFVEWRRMWAEAKTIPSWAGRVHFCLKGPEVLAQHITTHKERVK